MRRLEATSVTWLGVECPNRQEGSCFSTPEAGRSTSSYMDLRTKSETYASQHDRNRGSASSAGTGVRLAVQPEARPGRARLGSFRKMCLFGKDETA